MSNECSHKNPLVRDGASQETRAIKALDPSYAPIDERSLLDLLSYLKQYAGELNYYNSKNKRDGTWDVFFQKNCVCFLADINAFDADKARSAYNSAALVIDNPSKSNTAVRKALKSQFDLILTLIFEAEKWLRNTDKDLKLYNEIQKEISASLSLELYHIVSYYKKAVNIQLITDTDFDEDFTYPITASESILLKNSFKENWYRYNDPATGNAFEAWSDYYNSISYIPIYDPPSTGLRKQAKYSQYFLKKSFDKILSGYQRLLEKIDLFLTDMLTNYSLHEPHMALLLCFLRLFKYAQDEMNKLTARHLDFYLEEVLGLKKENAVADKVHLVFELAKGIEKHKVLKNTVLSAGKDAKGQEVLFYTSAETVFNTATISAIRNIYIDKANKHKVYASPVANSPDGIGGDFTTDPGQWKPFGEAQDPNSDSQSMPDASIGFMIASESFQMAEGERTIQIDIHCDFDPEEADEDLLKAVFNVYISGEKAWIKRKPSLFIDDKTLPKITLPDHMLFGNGIISLILTINREDGPITNLDTSVHDTRFDLKIPAVFVECSHDTDNYMYGFLKDIKISKVHIEVASPKTKTLLLQNDQSVVDPSKPFPPFGTIPKAGSSFIIGSKEIFGKNITELTLYGKWNEFPAEGIQAHYKNYIPQDTSGSGKSTGASNVRNYDIIQNLNKSRFSQDLFAEMSVQNSGQFAFVADQYYNQFPITVNPDYYSAQFTVTPWRLSDGEWTGITNVSKKKLFNSDTDPDLKIEIIKKDNPLERSVIESLPAKYDMHAKNGFIKLELDDYSDGFAFGHHIFPGRYAEIAIKQTLELAKTPANSFTGEYAADPPALDFPKEPYTPVIKDFYIAYKAEGDIEFGSSVGEKGNDGKFLQVNPFGYAELKTSTGEADRFLMPQFSHESDDGSVVTHQGELLIGFDKIEPPTALNLLFKVAEGSEDPELPAQQVDWLYLADDTWKRFEPSEILADNTKNLTTTGIISLSVPRFKSLKTNRLKKDLLWIMACTAKNTDAACDIIEIHPQAVLAEFKDNKNDPMRTGTALPAKSISKLKVKDVSVKSIAQPYASFGGKVKETSGGFYLRTSERLRHKHRGITIWDYERIILQEFPEIYKVKCINHTAYGNYEKIGEMDSEFAPGYITIIVIPKTFNQNAINPYEPKATKSKILEIEELIKNIVSPFAARKLKVLNPLYEQIQLKLEVKFHKQYTDVGFYEKQLNEDIKRYLSPWAYTTGKDITLGGSIHKSVLIDFIEELPYVDYIGEVKMYQYIDRVLYNTQDIDTATPSRARSAFVTINDPEFTNEHIITAIP